MIYAEFIDRDRAMPIEIFLGSAIRLRIGPKELRTKWCCSLGVAFGSVRSQYLCLWEVPWIARLDSWEAYFHSLEGRPQQPEPRDASRHPYPAGGALRCSQPGGDPRCAALSDRDVDPQDAGDDFLRGAVADRARRHKPIRPILLLRRLGRAGPEPAALSIWSAPDYAALEPILRDDPNGRPETCGRRDLSALRRGSALSWRRRNLAQA